VTRLDSVSRRNPHGRGHPLLRQLRKDKFSAAAALALAVLALAAITGDLLAPHDPNALDVAHRLVPPIWNSGGDIAFPLGTDFLGRDLLSRIISGARISLFVGVITAVIVAIIGTTLGVSAGFFRGRVDQVVMGLTDIIMAFPAILLLLGIVAMTGRSLTTIILALSVRFWTSFARLGRSMTLSIAESDYVTAAQAIGSSRWRIIRLHILPNILSPILVLAALEAGRIMLSEAAISFLGYGIQAPLTSWGLMMADGKNYLSSAWWTVTFPGFALFLTILALITLQNFLRVATDPLHRPRANAPAGGTAGSESGAGRVAVAGPSASVSSQGRTN